MNCPKFRGFKCGLLVLLSCCAFVARTASAAFGDIYAVAPSGSINKYTPAGSAAIFASSLTTPNCIAIDKTGNVYVGEGSGAAGKITKIAPNGTKTPFASGVEVNGLTCDFAGNLYASDGLTQSILKFTPAGARTTFASSVSTYDLVWVTGFSGPGLYAADFGGGVNGQGKVYVFNTSGEKFTLKSALNKPKRLAADGGTLYVGTTDGVVLALNVLFGDGSNPTYTTGLGNLQGMVCDSSHSLYVATSTGIVKFTNPGKVKTTPISADNFLGLAIEPPRDLNLNISTRLGVQTGENVLIAGFIITGPDHKSVLIRGMGPSLSNFGIANPLQDPTIAVHFPNGVVATNDNWKTGNAQPIIQGTAFAPSDDRESALAYNIPPGNYSVILRGVNNTTGIGLVEVYDTQQTSANSSLANISTRGFVGGGDNVMIGGFILGGVNGGGRVIIRAIGPSLSAAGVANPLADPKVELRNSAGTLLTSNDDWESDVNSLEIQALGVAPSNTKESALMAILPSGNYTAVMSSNNGGTGVGLVEIYNLR